MRCEILVGALFLTMVAAQSSANTRNYDFRVFLDDREIGEHRFEIREQDAGGAKPETYVYSEASFRVKFLFVTLFDYSHRNAEVWRGNCLHAIDAHTDNNGEQLFVRGKSGEQGLLLDSSAGAVELDGCVRTFAYWAPDLLESRELLNVQTGELVSVELERLGESPIQHGDESLLAEHFRLTGDKISIDLWYSADREWLALESTVESGSRLSYRAK